MQTSPQIAAMAQVIHFLSSFPEEALQFRNREILSLVVKNFGDRGLLTN